MDFQLAHDYMYIQGDVFQPCTKLLLHTLLDMDYYIYNLSTIYPKGNHH